MKGEHGVRPRQLARPASIEVERPIDRQWRGAIEPSIAESELLIRYGVVSVVMAETATAMG